MVKRLLNASGRWLPGIAIVLAVVLPELALGCPNCKGTLADEAARSSDGANMVQGYFYSILFMMSMPFILSGILIFAIRQQSQRTAATASNQHLSE